MNANDNLAEVLIAEWPRSSRETIRVTLHRYQGRRVFSIRAWYHDGDGTARPGRDGATLGLNHLAPVLDALAEIYRLACERGLIDPDHDNAVS